ncbi:MAG: PorP/SprF family type IX secretion system membrane protein [Crocinitomicaceae bacterium]
MMIRKILIILTLFLFSIKVKAQDFHLSMYDAAPLYINPAMTGLFDGNWRVHAQYRNQWKAINYKPYSSALVSFDLPYKKWGFGVQIANYRAGAGNYNVFQAVLSAAYTFPLGAKKYHNLSFGIQGGVTNKSVQYQLLTYDNQYTTDNGGGFNTGTLSGENFQTQSRFTPVANFGALYYFSKQQSRLNPFLGVSVFNLLMPKESFFGTSDRLPMRLYVHAGVRINITELLYIIPKVLVMNQKNFNEQTFAVDVGYYLKSPELYLLGGLIYRTKDAFVISLGIKKSNITAKIAYDINASSLTKTSSGRGAFEISLTYVHQNKKPREEKICPRL